MAYLREGKLAMVKFTFEARKHSSPVGAHNNYIYCNGKLLTLFVSVKYFQLTIIAP